MPQRNVATNFTFEQQRVEINELAADFWTQKGTVDTAAPTYLLKDGSNDFTGATLGVPNAFTINSNSGAGTVTINANLQVQGTTTTLNSTTLEIADKNIVLAKGSANDAAADGAGLTIDSNTDKTFNFVDADDAFVSSIGLKAVGGFTGNITGNVTGDLTGTASKVNLTSESASTTAFRVPFTSGNSGSVDLYADNSDGITYKPSDGTLSVQKLEGTIVTAAQTSITSVGSLTGLDVDTNDGTDNHTIANFNGLITGGNMAGLKIQYFACGSDDARAGLYWQHENIGNHRMWMDDAGILRQKASNPTSDTDGEPYVRLDTTNTGNLTILNTASGGQSVTLKIGASNASGVNDGIIKIVNGGTGNGVLQWDYEGNANRAQIYVYRSNQELRFTTAGGQRLSIGNTGHVLPGADNTQDLGSSTLRWANVYTGDMHLNNMNSGGNEVDGSEGHWTMQEGSDDLFLINRNTGKKYKFNLTEVS